MEIQFCENCDNLLYIYSELSTNNLYFGCRACSNTKPFESDKPVYNSNQHIDISEHIKNNKWLRYDITLPKIIDNPNIQCPNEECDKKNIIKYIKYDNDNLKYIYICDNCNTKWNNQ